MNVLMISVDDLRPLLGCYGHQYMHTPNIDRIAAEGICFEQAFCQVPVCGASRASLLTGLRPTPDRFVNFYSAAQEDAPGVKTLLHCFKEQGYRLAGNRKIFHDSWDHKDLWEDFYESPIDNFPGPYNSEEGKALFDENQGTQKRGPAYESPNVDDKLQVDGDSVEHAIAKIAELAKSEEPFLYAYGSINVHLPFKAPETYWDLYPREKIDVSGHDCMPTDAGELVHNWGELRNYAKIPDTGALSDDQATDMVQGYRAGVSYLDAQIGKLLNCLDENGLSENTAIIFWVDHGFNLGEHGLWCKHSLYETSVQVPLMIKMPGKEKLVPGTRIKNVVENLDLYPTICDLFGFEKPNHLQGRSLLPMLENSEVAESSWDAYAISRFHNGDSIRTNDFRYCEWLDETGAVFQRALFDHRDDHNERVNLEADGAYSEIVEKLSEALANKRSEALANRT